MQLVRKLPLVRLGALLALVGVVWLLATPAQAADDPGLNLTTSPLPINLATEPGKTVTTDLKVKNSGTKTEKLKVSLLKFSAFGEEGKPRLMDREPGDDYFDWVSFSKPTFDAEPGAWKTITMTIKVPKTAAFGYYYAVVFSRADEEKVQPSSRQTALVGATATLVLLEAQVPNAKRDVEVLGFKSDNSFYEYLPAAFSIKLHNKGNIHVAPAGNIFISKGKKSIGSVEVNITERGNILPGSNRIFTANWADGFPVYNDQTAGDKVALDKNGKAIKTLKWDLSQVQKLRVGHYTATLVMAYDDGKKDVPISATYSFWVIPWRLILIGIAIPVVPALLVYLFMRWRFKKKR